MDHGTSQYEHLLFSNSREAVENSFRESIDVTSFRSTSTSNSILLNNLRQSPQIPLLPDSHINPEGQQSSSDGPTDEPSVTGTSLSSPTTTVRPSRLRSFLSFLNDWWFWELSGIIMGSSCIAAVIGILIQTNGMALNNWAYSIQPNTLVSIFMTITKAALLVPISQSISQIKWIHFYGKPQRILDLQSFDDASRGPWGSLQFLIGMKTRNLFASCGAFMTLAAMTLDPLAQQIVAYPSRQVPLVHGDAYVNATQKLDFQGIAGIQNSLDTETQGAVFQRTALNSSNLFRCTTSQCHWAEPFSTLGICSTCRDVLSEKQAYCSTVSDSYDLTKYACNYTISELSLPVFTIDNGTERYAWTKMLTAVESDEILRGNKSIIRPKRCLTLPEKDSRCLTSFIHYYSEFGNFDEVVLRRQDYTYSPLANYNIKECDIYWCAREYEDARVSNGSFSAVLNTSHTLEEITNLNSTKEWESFDSHDALYLDEIMYLRLPEDLKRNETFVIDIRQHNALAQLLSSIMRVNQTANYSSSGVEQSDYFGIMIVNDNITRFIEEIAESLSNRIRYADSSYRVHGTAFRDETYISVRWKWAALPPALLLLTAFYLACAVLQNAKRGTALWKSSSLALLFHELEGWQKNELAVKDMEDLQHAVADIRAQVGDESGGLKFVRCC
ncbi:uncharacterized protein K452DRAFT_306628 [Aplosporella prunicola CBS 121167]|uniref:Uncharacterized protein n=1 Tax=Aplosporella prunicola CBS 121167 TaxID=1176127 RepID=A0A6A6BKS8_9PEZI|nr:uncharacterized protein K452DRAFT_306628 [Aplosporella prunicola CBS 121167]KAF2143983.1 hypothetical protein K452DRAFT_306628 [Aplosporella prunicola CBS 121167]